MAGVNSKHISTVNAAFAFGKDSVVGLTWPSITEALVGMLGGWPTGWVIYNGWVTYLLHIGSNTTNNVGWVSYIQYWRKLHGGITNGGK